MTPSPRARLPVPSVATSLGLLTLAAASGLSLASACAAAPSVRPALATAAASELAADAGVRDLMTRYVEDRATLERFHDLPGTPTRDAAFARLADEVDAALARLEWEALGVEGRLDATLLADRVASDRRRAERERVRDAAIADLVPFAPTIAAFHASYRAVQAGDPEANARELERLCESVAAASRALPDAKAAHPPGDLRRAARRVQDLREALDAWYGFRAGYDPLATWWTRAPHETAANALATYAGDLRAAADLPRDPGSDRERTGPIVGEPIGRAALLEELASARIPYTPEELIAIAERELAWCTREARAASNAMGLGDDWKAALERVKQDHVAPGEQPALVAALAREAIDFVTSRDLVTVPSVCAEAWRMSMLSPEAQRVAPFFLGGEEVQVAFPTDAMSTDEKRMSMRGNNRHFAHATVLHEIVPGHGLQQYCESRWSTHRRPFSTPFWTEGWALYWEMRFFDLGYHATPEDRLGALFWRMHRCERVRFSLAFHLGQKSPAECVDELVESVGHERANAEAEVRRSLEGGYGPLYQCAYLIGGLQFRALHEEFVVRGGRAERDFHDAILHGGNMPIELVRARLLGTKLARGAAPAWRFDG